MPVFAKQAMMLYKGETINILAPDGIDEHSAFIQDEVAVTMDELDLTQLASGYQQLDLLLRIAVNGVYAAEGTELQMQMYNLRRMFVDLVSDSVETVRLFEARSQEAARATSSALRFLFKGKETFALSRLAACEK
jgi:hypothetical protein